MLSVYLYQNIDELISFKYGLMLITFALCNMVPVSWTFTFIEKKKKKKKNA